MGQNLALNIEEHGFSVAVWNLETEWTERFVQQNAGKRISGAKSLEEFVKGLRAPRRMLMMIKAGEAVDSMIAQLSPLLEAGDILIDGGNSWFKDTQRREKEMRAKRLRFFGMGVSGGEAGARHGPSLMPGGELEAYRELEPVLTAIAAKSDSGACVTHVGPDGAGHFVKMVHNGIEYGDMQLIAEAYDLLHRALGFNAGELAGIFDDWNRGALKSPRRFSPSKMRAPASLWSMWCWTRLDKRAPASGPPRRRWISSSRREPSPPPSRRACSPA
jgi:6-phosphogluconate dehydrogenase